MKNTLFHSKKHNNSHGKLCVMASIFCFIFIGISVFANSKEKEYQFKNNELSTEIESLKATKANLHKANKTLLESSSDLDALLDELAEINN
ncbi:MULTISPECIES: hypothetical protein [unclassified Clostridium]|uniref:hypothetical protein n=1 Tax=unclassified Clostridium TaxID=2614128 RepID=UPI000E8BEBA5|nr:hypothetical protein [Clostridium sp.]